MKNKSIVVIGGGTGTFSVLRGLQAYTSNISAIVNMVDSGGSARKERDEWGLLPSSDIRKSLIALSDVSTADSLILRDLFEYRYDQGKGVSGMTFGNLFLVALTKLLGSQKDAIEKAGEFLKINGRVIPVTMDTVDLVAEYDDGSRIVGEHFIDEPKHNGHIRIKNLKTKPKARILAEAKNAIDSADAIIIGPGGFYTTILATLVVGGVREAIEKSSAQKIFILNLMTEYGQTYGFTAKDFIMELHTYLDSSKLDFVLINKESISQIIVDKYMKSHAEPVKNNLKESYHFRVVEADLLSHMKVNRQKGDTLNRSLVRHDPEKIAKICMQILGLL